MTKTVVLGLIGVFLAFQVWVGWRKGLARMAASIGALLAAAASGFAVGHALFQNISGAVPVGGFTMAFAAAVATSAVVYLAIRVGSSLLLKRTEHQKFGPLKLLFGVGGAFLGLLYGLCFVAAGITAVRALATLAEAQTAAPQAQRPGDFRTRVAVKTVEVKDVVNATELGRLVAAADPVPPEIYRLLEKLARLAASPDAAARFAEFPDVQTLMEDPKINSLLADPEIVQAIQNGNYLQMLTNRKIIAAANDPALAERLGKFPFEKALDYALASPSPGPKSPGVSD